MTGPIKVQEGFRGTEDDRRGELLVRKADEMNEKQEGGDEEDALRAGRCQYGYEQMLSAKE